jgi:hypothetical protein
MPQPATPELSDRTQTRIASTLQSIIHLLTSDDLPEATRSALEDARYALWDAGARRPEKRD